MKLLPTRFSHNKSVCILFRTSINFELDDHEFNKSNNLLKILEFMIL